MTTFRSSASRRRVKAPLGERYEAALALAYAQLAVRARSTEELRRRLLRAGATAEVIDRVLGRLAELRYIDDEAFAASRAQSLRRRAYGPNQIARRLYAAGIANHLARQASHDEEESDSARAALERRLRGRSPQSLLPPEAARLMRWLLSRGFSFTAARHALQGKGDDARLS